MMSVLIGGGTGFVGRHLSRMLVENGFKVTLISRQQGPERITWNDLQKSGLPECTAVVNCAGENILNPLKRWNEKFKKDVYTSRVETTKTIADAICKAEKPPKVFVCMSGVAYYRPHELAHYDENSICDPYDFLSELVHDWEAASVLPKSVDTRRVVVRSGVVLGRDGGMIQQIFPAFYLGAGGRIGSGKQWLPWIHVADVAGIITYAIMNDKVTGILNGVAPNPCTNAEFTTAFAKAMWRPAIFPVPAFAMNLMFGEERGKVILEGQQVVPERTLATGYKYLFPDLDSACKEFSRLLSH